MGQIICMGQTYSGGDMTSVSGWDSSMIYRETDIVRYHSVTYRCTQNCQGQEPSATSSYWTASSVGDAVNLINHRPGGGADIATPTTVGTVMPDNVTITINSNGVISSLPSLNMKVVSELPTEGISTSTIYLVPKSEGSTQGDIYTEFIYIDNTWERIGSTAVDLTDYLKKTGDGSSLTSSVQATQLSSVTSITSGSLSEILGQINANLEVLKSVEAAAGKWIRNQTIPAGSTTYTISNDVFKTSSIVTMYYSADSLKDVSDAVPSYSTTDGSLVVTFSNATASTISINSIHVVNVN